MPLRPFRWDLVRRDQLGTLLDGGGEPDLWFLDDLIDCSARLLARCADGELFLVGRSLDSVYDLLSGALSGTSWADRIQQVPFSAAHTRADGLHAIEAPQVRQLRANLTAAGLSPYDLARRRRPLVFADIINSGHTFRILYRLLRDWIEDERAQWDVIRGKLGFLGVTIRERTSPNTWRWHQVAEWPNELPARAVRNVSLDFPVWSYLGDRQTKLTPSFHRRRWSDDAVLQPDHGEASRSALAEAVALVEIGRERDTRRRLTRVMVTEPAMAERWLRSLISELR
ncbi:hypothetical protein GCM10009780_56890 [Actinomadura alba]